MRCASASFSCRTSGRENGVRHILFPLSAIRGIPAPMRFPRLVFAGARRRVMNRGARLEPVFLDDESRALFLGVLSEFSARFCVRVHGFARMPNHYHLMLDSVTGDLPRAMRDLGGSYSQRRLVRWPSWPRVWAARGCAWSSERD